MIPPYNQPLYPITHAAHYLHIPTPTLRLWLTGRTSPQPIPPLIQRPHPQDPRLSFLNLIEAHILRIIRETHRIKLNKIRHALDYLSQSLETPHPLAQQQFKTDGVDLFVEEVDRLINVSRSGQLALREAFTHLLDRVEWNDAGIAIRLFPLLSGLQHPHPDRLIVLDPNIRCGQPILTGTGVPTAIIADLYNAGDSIEDLAEEYNCTPIQIKTAIQFEYRQNAA